MTISVLHGDCLAKMRELAAEGVQVQSIITDPPYGLSKEPDIAEVLRHWLAGDDYKHTSAGFMGKSWDSFVPGPAYWKAAYDLLPPGGHLLCFAGTRTSDLMSIALRMAGFEIRDCIMFLFGTGFPKSHNLPGGFGTALKPAYEPIIVARKPLDGTVANNVLAHGVGALNIDACRVAGRKDVPASVSRGTGGISLSGSIDGSLRHEDGTGSGFDPSIGRWPANIIHDGSYETEEAFAVFGEKKSAGLYKNTGTAKEKGLRGGDWDNHIIGFDKDARKNNSYAGDTGTASRFFYSAKASASDRAGSKHPTVKPIALMQYLVRLVTPPGGTVLDPFAGSGTTLAAAHAEGFNSIGIEKEDEYHADILRRVEKLMAAPDQGSMF